MATSKSTPKKRQPANRRLSTGVKPKVVPKAAAKPKRKPSTPKNNIRALELTFFLGASNKVGFRFELTTPIKNKRKKAKPKQKAAASKQAEQTKNRKALTTALITVGLVGIIHFGAQLIYRPSLTTAPVVFAQSAINKPKVKSLSQSDAVKIRIDSIGVNSPVEIVGRTDDGSISVPSDGKIAGQYSLGPTPGERGPSIIVGHVDSLFGSAVFWRLHELTAGEIIKVAREDGTTASFKIYDVKDFPQENFPGDKVYGNTDQAELRLITCGGSFDFFKQRYESNTVVFARLI